MLGLFGQRYFNCSDVCLLVELIMPSSPICLCPLLYISASPPDSHCKILLHQEHISISPEVRVCPKSSNTLKELLAGLSDEIAAPG